MLSEIVCPLWPRLLLHTSLPVGGKAPWRDLQNFPNWSVSLWRNNMSLFAQCYKKPTLRFLEQFIHLYPSFFISCVAHMSHVTTFKWPQQGHSCTCESSGKKGTYHQWCICCYFLMTWDFPLMSQRDLVGRRIYNKLLYPRVMQGPLIHSQSNLGESVFNCLF